MTGAFGVPTCSNCAQAAVDGRLEHENSCPLGMEIDRIVESDRAWFEAHPHAAERRRPISWAEDSELKILEGHQGTPVGDAIVRSIASGVRGRLFHEVRWVPGGSR